MKKLNCIALPVIMAGMLAIAAPLGASAFNLGGALGDVLGGGKAGSSGSSVPAASVPSGYKSTPDRIYGTDTYGGDEHSNYIIKGRLIYAGGAGTVPEYTDVLLSPAGTALNGTRFESGYYHMGHTNTAGEFELPAKPGTYVVFAYSGRYAAITTAEAVQDGETITLTLTDRGSKIQFKRMNND